MKLSIELEVTGELEDALYVVSSILDTGLLQDAINEHTFDAGLLRVDSAVVVVSRENEG